MIHPLKQARESLNLSLRQAARQLGCAKPHLWQIEHGISANPSARLLNAFRRVYGLSPEFLLDLYKE